MSTADRSIAITINAQKSAQRIAKEFNLQSSRVLNILSQCAGASDFGALKSKQKDTSQAKQKETYGLVKFTCVHSGWETPHTAVFKSCKPNDLDALEKAAIDFVLCFYDSPGNFEIEDADLDESENTNDAIAKRAYEKRLEELNNDGSFWCAGGEVLTRGVIFREITKEQFDAVQLSKTL